MLSGLEGRERCLRLMFSPLFLLKSKLSVGLRHWLGWFLREFLFGERRRGHAREADGDKPVRLLPKACVLQPERLRHVVDKTPLEAVDLRAKLEVRALLPDEKRFEPFRESEVQSEVQSEVPVRVRG